MEERKLVPNLKNCQQEQEIDQEYRQIVEEAVQKDENFDIPNSTVAHAIFLSQKLISETHSNIKILTGELYNAYCNKIKDSLQKLAEDFKRFNKRDRIKIIVWEKDAKENSEFNDFVNKYKDVIKVRKANKPGSNKISHFLVSDLKRYRTEAPHTKEELYQQKVNGKANFNNPDKAKILNNAFDKIWAII